MSMQSTDLPTGSYQYRPINPEKEIRVIKLEPASVFDDPLVIKLLTFAIWTDDRYDCVSYCWGDLRDSVLLECENQWLSVTPNVESMLQHLRKTVKPRYLWVDAICINQENNEEKAVQVRQMSLIFKSALKVHIWLGEAREEHHISSVFSALRCIARDTLTKEDLGRYDFRSIITSLAHFLERPWYTRRWIIQELVSAHVAIFHCGNHHMSWNWILPALAKLLWLYRDINQPFLEGRLCTDSLLAVEAIVNLQSESYGSLTKESLPDLLWNHHVSECKDERDRLFALYGISDSRLPFDLTQRCPVDYTKHFVRVYTQLTQAMFIGRDPTDWVKHMCAFGNLSQQNIHWPSWVPSWNKQRDMTKSKRSMFGYIEANFYSTAFLGKQWDVLQVSTRVGQIVAVQQSESMEQFFTEWHPSHCLKELRHLQEKAEVQLRQCFKEGEGEEGEEENRQDIYGHSDSLLEEFIQKRLGSKIRDAASRKQATSEKATSIAASPESVEKYGKFQTKYADMLNACVALCMRYNGFAMPGIAFTNVQLGDCVLFPRRYSALYGLEDALVLRPATEIPGCFRIVGACSHGELSEATLFMPRRQSVVESVLEDVEYVLEDVKII